MKNKGCAIADLDFKAAFDYLCMEWVYLVLERKDLTKPAIDRIKRYYNDSYTIPIVNCIPGKEIKNNRLTL